MYDSEVEDRQTRGGERAANCKGLLRCKHATVSSQVANFLASYYQQKVDYPQHLVERVYIVRKMEDDAQNKTTLPWALRHQQSKDPIFLYNPDFIY